MRCKQRIAWFGPLVQHRGKHGGLARMENERYHQFLIWRAILPVWHAVLERDESCDLIVECENGKHFFEMKNWRGNTGNSQLPAMQRDIRKLQARLNGYFIVTAINPSEATDKNFEYLLTKLTGLNGDERQDYRFTTEGLDGAHAEFWIAGWPVLKSSQPST